MELIFKRFVNVLSTCITVGLFYGIGNYIGDSAYNELSTPFAIAAVCYSIVFAINYIFLGAATLWHKNVNKKIV